MKTSITLLVAALIIAGCQQNQKTKQPVAQAKAAAPVAVNDEDKVVDLIIDLPEVKMRNAEVERLSKGKRHLSTYVESKPSAENTNYTVKVAEDNGNSLVTYYTFEVDSKTRNIKYYDVVQDSLITLESWRKTTPLKDR